MSDEIPPIVVRLMDATDLDCGFLEAVSALRPTELTKEQAIEVYQHRLRSRVRTYVAVAGHQIAGTASLFIEPKYIHSGGIVGHIEDVAVNTRFQKLGIGRALVEHLLAECRQMRCYKVILDCAETAIPFYEKLGFHRWERAMRIDLDVESR